MHGCLVAWLRAGEALTSFACLVRVAMSDIRSLSRGSHAASTLASNWSEESSVQGPTDNFFFLIAGCNGSPGYWQSLATRESNKQHQWYCVPKESQVPIHYNLIHQNLCMTERMVHKREKRHTNTRKTKARKHQPPTKTNTHNQTQNHRQHQGET